MRTHLLTASSAVLFSVLLALTASIVQAKGPADKITVTSPGGADPIEITNPEALSEFSPWDDKFMDATRGVVADPHATKVYRVSIQVKPQWLYSFDYAPDPSGGPGYIYLPGPGDPRYQRNIGTIIRNLDGRWLYASQDWGTLIESLLSSAAATPKTLPATGAGPLPDVTWIILLGVLILAVGASLLWRASTRKTQ